MNTLWKIIVQQIVVHLQGLLFEGEEFHIVIRKSGNPQITKTGNSISYIPSQKYINSSDKIYILNLKEFEKLNNPSKVSLENLKTLLQKNLEGCRVTVVMIKGQVEGLQIEWDDIEVSIEGIDYQVLTSNKRIPVEYGILEVITLKPDWLVKGGAGSKMEDRFLLGFDKYNQTVFEGKMASYVVKGNGLKYRNTCENLRNFRKRADVTPIDHKGARWKERLVEALTKQ